MLLHDPTVNVPNQNKSRAPVLASLQGKRIGLLSNSKVNADVLLQETAQVFREKHGCEVLDLQFKHNASAPAPSDTIASLAQASDFLITASGD